MAQQDPLIPPPALDGATTALRRWSKRWKALAKSYHQRHVWNGEVIRRQQRALEEAAASDGAMVLTLQLKELRAKYDRDISDKELAHQAETARLREELESERYKRGEERADLIAERAAREQAEKDHGEAQNRLYFVERERDTALAKLTRVETLMTGNSVTVGALCRALEDDSPAPVTAPCAQCALLLRRLRFRNETIAFLTNSKLAFNEDDTPEKAGTLIFHGMWLEMRKQARFYAEALRVERRRYRALQREAFKQLWELCEVGHRLRVKRAEAAHWQQALGQLEQARGRNKTSGPAGAAVVRTGDTVSPRVSAAPEGATNEKE